MRAVIQRVSAADVVVNGGAPRAIGRGLMILLGVRDTDTPVSYTHLDVYQRQLRVCVARAPVPVRRALRTLNHAKQQQVRFC